MNGAGHIHIYLPSVFWVNLKFSGHWYCKLLTAVVLFWVVVLVVLPEVVAAPELVLPLELDVLFVLVEPFEPVPFCPRINKSTKVQWHYLHFL